MIFNDALLQAGPDGGAEAASKLHEEITKHIESKIDDTNHFDIVVQLYCNFIGLANKLTNCGILERPADLRAWIHSFNYNQGLFNFIDVGEGKERADHKIKESLRLFINNKQCKQILFGGCHDAGYLTFLDQYKLSDKAPKITLIQCVAEQHVINKYKSLNFSTVNLNSVFRSTALVDRPKPVATPPSSAPTPLRRGSGNTSFTAASNGASSEGKTFVFITPTSARESNEAPKRLYQNSKSERVDVPLFAVEDGVMKRINAKITRDGKYCNEFHLTGKCSKKSNCPYVHGERLLGQEQLALRTKARNAPCQNGSECNKPGCFYGHHCPNIRCAYPNCYFEHLHGIDTVSFLTSCCSLIAN